MQEYSTTVKSADVGLTWESHYAAKKGFEVIYIRFLKLIITFIYLFVVIIFFVFRLEI